MAQNEAKRSTMDCAIRVRHLSPIFVFWLSLWVWCGVLNAQPLTKDPSVKCLELGFVDGSKEFQECVVMLAPEAPPAVLPTQHQTAGLTAPSASRLDAVGAIAKPQTLDGGENEYLYGFNLWNAGFYPEARQQLTKFLEQYPNHSRISFGRDLLGRAFLDDNMPEEAARWFLRNYQSNKAGDRAPDSLLYLGASMIAMKDAKRACIALREFRQLYTVEAAGRLQREFEYFRRGAACG